MERRVLLAIVLSLGLIFLVNIIFPPVTPVVDPTVGELGRDSLVEGGVDPAELDPAELEPAQADLPSADSVPGAGEEGLMRPVRVVAEDTVLVRSDLYEVAISTRGAGIVGARLLRFESYDEGAPEAAPVELVPEGARFLRYGLAVGRDTVRADGLTFTPSRSQLELTPGQAPDSVSFVHEFPGAAGRFVVTYHFRPDAYLFDVTGRVEGLSDRGWVLLLDLATGLRSNEKNVDEDVGQSALVTNGDASGVESLKFGDVTSGEVRPAAGGPFHWIATRSKYFLVAALAPTEGPLFGGASLRGGGIPQEATISTSLPVAAGSGGFRFSTYMGPQDYGRLDAIGQDLQDVSSYGYGWIQPIIRPLVAIVMPILVWMHTRFDLAYGWVLILFGVLMRVVLFPLYQKSMRAQIGQMRLQPIVQEIREKHKDDPQKMQQEMMRVYKEEGVNPLAGCLPMLVPMPILFTLFFVFQGTIEFRGVPFLWLPDLSLKDPLYVIPLVMGASMFLLQWIGQRGMNVVNTQMKVMMYAMPVFFTFLFANFPSGLNLYYTTSNLASLPQQLYIARERRAANAEQAKETGEEAAKDSD